MEKNWNTLYILHLYCFAFLRSVIERGLDYGLWVVSGRSGENTRLWMGIPCVD